MSTLFSARALMGSSLAFHIIFASLGVGLPILLCASEGLALKTGHKDWMILTKRWSKAFAILFVVGAVSGTVISFEMGLLWPTFIQFSGSIIGLPFALEGYAFFLEAIFLGLYLYGWDRLSPLAHWLCSFPLVISGAASAWFVVSANSWMNTPAGFLYKDGKVVGVDPIAAMFNPSTPYETTHMILASYQATGFGVAALCAWGILRGRKETWLRKGLFLSMIIAIAVAPLQVISGDLNARFLADVQPAKFAAMEGLYKTTSGAPITIGGWPDATSQEVKFGIEIPYLLSILAHEDPRATVKGLDQIPVEQQPNPQIVHPAFDIMVGCGFLALVAAFWFWFLYWRGRRSEEQENARRTNLIDRIRYFFTRGTRVVPEYPLLLRLLMICGPLMFIAIESGWIVTEEGRQPWVIQGYLLTKNAATTAPGVNVAFMGFLFLYILLSIVTILLLRRLDRFAQTDIAEEVPVSSEEQRVE
jgi:cytochrome d ubiquinol oxidase subunit I